MHTNVLPLFHSYAQVLLLASQCKDGKHMKASLGIHNILEVMVMLIQDTPDLLSFGKYNLTSAELERWQQRQQQQQQYSNSGKKLEEEK